MSSEIKYVVIDDNGEFTVVDDVHVDAVHDDRYYSKSETYWLAPVATAVDLPLTGNKHGDTRLILDTRYAYTWIEIETIDADGETIFVGDWHPVVGRYWGEPVDSNVDLPLTGNLDGEIRYVQDVNSMFVWDSTSASWNAVTQPAAMLYWQEPVNTVGDLPLTGNANGDVRLVLDTNDLYRWNGGLTEWQSVTETEDLFWLEPVNTIGDLPATGNTNGEVKLVLSNNELYRWNSTASDWEAITAVADIYWLEPVANSAALPLSGNRDGEVRLTKNDNNMYRWNDTLSSWVAVSTAGGAVSVGYEEQIPDSTEAANDYITLEDSTVTSLLPTSNETPTSLRTANIYVSVYLNGVRLSDGQWSYGYVSGEKRIEFDGTGLDAVNLDTDDEVIVEIIKT